MPGTPPGILLPSKSIFPGVTSADGLVIEIAGVLLRGASRCRIRLYFSVFRCFCPLSPLPPSLRGRVLGRNVQLSAFPRAFAPSSPDTLPFLAVFCIPVRFCPIIPPAPFSHKGRRGSLGVLMPETEDGTQGLPQQPSLVSIPPNPHKGRRGLWTS